MRGARCLAGIDLNKARSRSLVDTVVGLATEPDGFTLAQLAAMARQRTGWNSEIALRQELHRTFETIGLAA